MHEDSTSDQSIDIDVPHSTSTLGPRDVDVKKLIFVNDGREPERECSADSDKRSEWGIYKSNSTHPEKIDDNDRVFEISGFSHFSNFSGCMIKHKSSDRDHGELDELNQFKDD